MFTVARWRAKALMSSLLVCVCIPTMAQVTASSRPATQQAIDPNLAERVNKLLKGMDDDDYHVRQAASDAAEGLPIEALPLLDKALASDQLSPEVMVRLDTAAARIRRQARTTAYERQIQEAVRYERDLALEGYAQGGHTDPRWDAAAKQAIVLSICPRHEYNRTARDDVRTAAALKKAIDLGCDDPLIRYLDFRQQIHDHTLVMSAAVLEQLGTVIQAVLDGHYPAWYRCGAALYRARQTVQFEHHAPPASAEKAVWADLNTALDLFPQATAAADFPSIYLHDAAVALLVTRMQTQIDDVHRGLDRGDNSGNYSLARRLAVGNPPHFPGMDIPARGNPARGNPARGRPDRDNADGGNADSEVDPTLEAVKKCAHSPTAALLIEGAFHLKELQEMEDVAAHSIFPEFIKPNQTIVDKLLDESARALNAAWEKDADDPTAPTLMIVIADRKQYPSTIMEQWFSRAMKANPSNLDACRNKLFYLEHHDDDEALLAFGQECLATQNWQARLPFVLPEVHYYLAKWRLDGPRNDHLSDEAAWQDVQNVNEEYLRRYPGMVRQRNVYASMAAHSGHWQIAQTQLQILGNDVDYDCFNGKAEFDYLRRKMEKALGIQH